MKNGFIKMSLDQHVVMSPTTKMPEIRTVISIYTQPFVPVYMKVTLCADLFTFTGQNVYKSHELL